MITWFCSPHILNQFYIRKHPQPITIKMGTYITVVGKDHYPVLNSIWAVLKEDIFRFDKLVLLETDNNDRTDLEKQIKELLKAYDIEASLEHSSWKNGIMYEDEEIALDISGADMESVVRLLINNDMDGLKHIFLLKSDDKYCLNTPYPLIDRSRLCLLDILDNEVKTVG